MKQRRRLPVSAKVDYLWGETYQILVERDLWLQVLGFHINHGVIEPQRGRARHEQIFNAYMMTYGDVRLDSINQRELRTKHDVKARIEEYNDLASAHIGQPMEYIHLGMTSADVVDNVSLIKMKESIASWITDRSICNGDSPEAEYTWQELQRISEAIPFRGIKGAVGTHQDQLDLLGDPDLCTKLDEEVAMFFGFSDYVLANVGQVYPRSIDLQVCSALFGLVCFNHDTPRAWRILANGYMAMIAAYSGSQWNEGDVSTSSIRRVALPGFFHAIDMALRKVNPE